MKFVHYLSEDFESNLLLLKHFLIFLVFFQMIWSKYQDDVHQDLGNVIHQQMLHNPFQINL